MSSIFICSGRRGRLFQKVFVEPLCDGTLSLDEHSVDRGFKPLKKMFMSFGGLVCEQRV